MNQEVIEKWNKKLNCATERICVWAPARYNHTQKGFLSPSLSPIFPNINSCFRDNSQQQAQEGHRECLSRQEWLLSLKAEFSESDGYIPSLLQVLHVEELGQLLRELLPLLGQQNCLTDYPGTERTDIGMLGEI